MPMSGRCAGYLARYPVLLGEHFNNNSIMDNYARHEQFIQNGTIGSMPTMNTKRALSLLGVVVALYFVAVFVTSDVSHAFVIGGDDGLELSKSLLLKRQPHSAVNMWNDQPWLHTIITASLFKVFGEKAWVPRLMSIVSTFVLIACINLYYSRYMSLIALAAVDVFLLTADEFNYMAFSGMTELPVIAWATIATLICAVASRMNNCSVLIASAIIYAAALHIKLTTLILMPCIVASCFLISIRRGISNLAIFGLSCAAANVILLAISPSFNLRQIWSTHADASCTLAIVGTDYVFKWVYLLQNPALLLASGAGMWCLLKNKSWSILLLPATFLTSIVCFTLLQKPWWKFYLIYFDLPLAVFAGFGLDGLRSLTSRETFDYEAT